MKDSLKLMRHHLGSIDLSDMVDEKELNEQERRDYCAAIHAVFPRLEKDVKALLYQQLLFGAKESADWEQVIFGRGVMEGPAILLEKWKAAHLEHMNRSNEEPFDKTNPLSEI